MFKKIGLIFHWIGFIIGILMVLLNLLLWSTDFFHGETSILLRVLPCISYILSFTFIGWIIRYLLDEQAPSRRKIPFFPFFKVKTFTAELNPESHFLNGKPPMIFFINRSGKNTKKQKDC